jgi:hypothetical protein
MKTHISISNGRTVSFVTRVANVRGEQGLMPGRVTISPVRFPGERQLRGLLLVRAAARKETSRLL